MMHVIEALGDWRGSTSASRSVRRHRNAGPARSGLPAVNDSARHRSDHLRAMVAAIGCGEVFSKGRDFGAWLGLVPKQTSTGDRTVLGRIEAWQSLPARSVRAGGLGCSDPAGELGALRGQALDQSRQEAAARQRWRSRSPTSSPVSPGAFWPMAGTSR